MDRDERLSAADFPEDFRFGAATSAYQVEGAVGEDGRGPSIWDTFSHIPGKIRGADTGDVACDHYHRFRTDAALMRELGIRHYRFSIAWPRIIPDGVGRIEPRGLAFYDRLVDTLLEHEIRPFPTLFHWDLPQALEDRGGWRVRSTADAFARYADVVGRALGDRVDEFATHNEPWCAAVLGYQTGQHAPGARDRGSAVRAAHHLLYAHGLASQALRAAGVRQVGIVVNPKAVMPATDSADDIAAAAMVEARDNAWFLDPLFHARYPEAIAAETAAIDGLVQDADLGTVAQPIDFVGVNYYQPDVVRGVRGPGGLTALDATPKTRVTQMGWPVDATALGHLLGHLAATYTGSIPLYVTENGAAYEDRIDAGGEVDDPDRTQYLREHLAAVREAARAGVPVKGYYVWSLLDNFEWAEGYARRFGIVYTDPSRPELRIPKGSARWYRSFLQGAAVRP